jgi:hypothetical protein
VNEATNAVGQEPARLASFSGLQSAHHQLLKRRSGGQETDDAYLAEIEAFVIMARATGAVISDDHERYASQSWVDYWSSVLDRAGRLQSIATLERFKPDLAPELDEASCPYRGLSAFREQDRSVFFGREPLIAELVTKLKESRFLAVLGPSGSGKSSLVLAGLLPILADSREWEIYPTMVPGSNPLANLATSIKPKERTGPESTIQQVSAFLTDPEQFIKLLEFSAKKPALLVVDQFEEVFTLCGENSREQLAFISILLRLIQKPGIRHSLVLTMREDYEPNVAKLQELKPYFDRDQVRVKPLAPKSCATRLRNRRTMWG